MTCGTTSSNLIYGWINGVPKGDEREEGTGKIIEEYFAINFLNLMKTINSDWKSSKMKPNTHTHIHHDGKLHQDISESNDSEKW